MSVALSSCPLQCDHGLRRQAILESLLGDICCGRLRPGEHLVTQALAQRFGVSHTPIREALVALAGIGVVDLEPNRGAMVRRFSAKDLCDLVHVRRALECEAVRLACGSIPSGELNRLAQSLRRLAAAKMPASIRLIARARELDNQLHDLIATHASNSFLAIEINRLKMLFRAMRDASWEQVNAANRYDRVPEEACEHLAIVAALQQGDRPSSVRAMSKHIRSGARYWAREAVESPMRDAAMAFRDPFGLSLRSQDY